METFKIGNLEVYKKDLPKLYGYEEGIHIMSGMGEGWRYPYEKEMGYLYDLSGIYDIGNFEWDNPTLYYWLLYPGISLISRFNFKRKYWEADFRDTPVYKEREALIRPVRNLY